MSAETIAAALTRDITAGLIAPGTDLPQADLAARFQVSRIPIRDALQRLAVDGLVTVTPNKGARVIRLNADEIREVYDLRILLEGDLLSRAIPKMTEQDQMKNELALERSNLEARTERWAEGDWHFHTALYAPANRPRQLDLVYSLRRTCQIHIAAYRKLPDQTARWLEDHGALVDGCRARDTDYATRVLQLHLRAACQALLNALPDDGGAKAGSPTG